MKTRLNNSGFTLVEALVALIVTTIMVLVITNFMLGNTEQSVLASNRDTMLKETEQSLDLLTNDIRLSANADQNNRWPDPNGPSGGANEFSWQSDGTTLVLATAAQDSSGNIIFSDPKDYITQKNNLVYFVQNGTLYKRTIAADVSGNSAVTSCPAAEASDSCPADKELLHNITSFSLQYLNSQNQSVTPTSARSIEVSVTVSKSVFGQPQTASYTTRMVFRND
ncbi:MAG TPA: prepilin-type N-terminal cleavage/methylation domain-containing protein [Candidatus Saccharimonadales bacterium]|nr:prepilin-type N-terminal cleavage/methylation domain-containing protein [Candidatus Saccharimonadales bacterium]